MKIKLKEVHDENENRKIILQKCDISEIKII